jgi:hypothetical protein
MSQQEQMLIYILLVMICSSIVYVKTYYCYLQNLFIWLVEIWESVEGKDGAFLV